MVAHGRVSARRNPHNIKVLACLLVGLGLVIGGSDSEEVSSVGNMVDVSVWSLRDARYRNGAHLPVGSILDVPTAPLTALATPTAVPVVRLTPTSVVRPNIPTPTLEGPESAICSYPWPCETALRIVYGPTENCPTGESNGDPNAISWNGTSYGLWQIWSGHAWRWSDFWENWADPVRNTEYAWELYQEQGWTPWECY